MLDALYRISEILEGHIDDVRRQDIFRFGRQSVLVIIQGLIVNVWFRRFRRGGLGLVGAACGVSIRFRARVSCSDTILGDRLLRSRVEQQNVQGIYCGSVCAVRHDSVLHSIDPDVRTCHFDQRPEQLDAA